MLTYNDLAELDPEDWRALLLELVNCTDFGAGKQTFERIIPDLSTNAANADSILTSWRNALRNIWVSSPQKRQWGITQLISVKIYGFTIPENHWPFINSPDFSLAPPTAIEALLGYLAGNKVHPARCPNPDCRAPYFFKVKGQKTCGSDQCVSWSKKQNQTRWWQGEGGEARKKKLKEEAEKYKELRAQGKKWNEERW
jgi:hypothetical protein